MSKISFDSSQVSSLFQIISPNFKNIPLSSTDCTNKENMQQKQKRKSKRPEVPVHKYQNPELQTNDNLPIRKAHSSSVHFHKSKHKHDRDRSFENKEDDKKEEDAASKSRIRRKHLMKENDRIYTENKKLADQLILTQNALAKRESQILKLKDKIQCVQTYCEDLVKENNIIKTQYEDILVNLEEFKEQIKMKCKTCDQLKEIIKQQNKDLEISKTHNKENVDDLNMLKNVVYRLNVQLERYQQKLQHPNAITARVTNSSEIDFDSQNNIITQQNEQGTISHNDHLHTPISWGNVNSHTLGPLLDAYQDTIREKEDIISKYELEFVNFTKKLKTIIEENEILHSKSMQESELLQKNISELEINRKEMKELREQNDLLIKKCALKHDKLQEICKVYDHKVETIKRDYDVLQEQYHKTRVELSSLQGKYHSLTEVHDSLKTDKENVIPLSVHTASVNECKRLFEELKNQYDIEKQKFLNQIRLLEQQISEMESKVVEVGTEKRELQSKIKSAERTIKKLEVKLTENHTMLTHTQISRDACKRQLGKAIEFGRELVNEQESLLQQLSSRNKENKAVKQIGSSIVSRMDILKSQLKTVQKDAYQQLASVEQRLAQQDSSMESMKRDHENEVEKLLQEIQDKDDYIARLVDKRNVIPPAPYLLYREKHVHLS